MIIHKHNMIKCWKFFSSSLFDDAGTIFFPDLVYNVSNAGFSDVCLVLDQIMFEWLKFGTFREFVLIHDLEIVKVLAFWNFDKHWNLSKKLNFRMFSFPKLDAHKYSILQTGQTQKNQTSWALNFSCQKTNFKPPQEQEILKGGSLAKSSKLFFQEKSVLEGKIQKMQKKIQKILLSQIVC